MPSLARAPGATPSRSPLQLRAAIAQRVDERAEPAPESGAAGRAPRWALAILPFVAAPANGNLKLLADALSEDVTTELARFPQLALLSRDSVGALAAQGLGPEHIAKQVGARLVLSGTVRGLGERARVSAALMDATTRLELWAQKWEVSPEDVFGALDRITRSVVGTLALRIDDARLERARRRPFERLEAYECWLRGHDSLRAGTAQADEAARSYFERALELAPDFGRAYAGISLSHFNDWSCQAWERWELRERLAFENARKAVELDEDDAVSQFILGRIQLYRREFELAHHHLTRAVALNPNDSFVLLQSAAGFAQLGEPQRALELTETAFWLSAARPDWCHTIAGMAQLLAGKPAEAAESISRAPDALVDSRAYLAVASIQCGDRERAERHAAKFADQFHQKNIAGRRWRRRRPAALVFSRQSVSPCQRRTPAPGRSSAARLRGVKRARRR